MALKEKESIYYYNVRVIDSETGNPIHGATVYFLVSGITPPYERTTNPNGEAQLTFSHIEDDNDVGEISIYEECLCGASATGYETIEVVEGEGYFVEATLNKNDPTYTEIELVPSATEYYYSFNVVDASTQEVIPSVTVERYNKAVIGDEELSLLGAHALDTQTTDNSGNCTFIVDGNNEDETEFSFRFVKNGYDTFYKTNISGTNQIANLTTTKVELNKSTKADYYYVVSVKDNGGSVIENAKIRLYKDLSYSQPYSNKKLTISSSNTNTISQVKDEIFYTLCEIISSFTNIDLYKINIKDTFTSLGIYFSEDTDIVDGIKSKFVIETIPQEDFDNIISVEDMVNYIKEHTGKTELPKTIQTTDSNGLISIKIGNLANQPNPIYAKGVWLPTDAEGRTVYIWDSKKSGTVNPTLTSTTPGLSLVAKSYLSTTNYYNFKVYDDQTKQPLSGVTVVYTNENGDKLGERTTDSEGIVQYNCEYSEVYISINTYSYKPIDKTGYIGDSVNDSYWPMPLRQKQSIYVCDPDGNPIAGKYIRVYGKDDLGGRTYFDKMDLSSGIGEYVTYETGYSNPIKEECYQNAFNYDLYVCVYKYENEESANQPLLNGTQTIILVIPKQEEGNYEETNDFEEFNNMTIYNIKNKVNSDNSDKVYYNSNDFRMRIVDPDSISVYDIFTCYPVIMSNNQKSVIGSVDIDMKNDTNDLRLKILNRYSGYYNPIFKDILFYKNYKAEDDNYHKVECDYSNTDFDSSYEDNYGKFGVIDNMWFHKVNDNKENKIIGTKTPYYPLIGQYALDNRSYNIFETNWDLNHFTRQVSVDKSKRCNNITSMMEGLCMFGSKYLNVPEMIEVCGFTLGDENYDGTWNDDWITNPDGCPGEVMFKEVNDNSIDFYFFIKKRILRYFRGKLKEEFEKYINSGNTFGNTEIDDDIDEYVTKNVLKLYKIDKVRIFVRRMMLRILMHQ